MSLLEHLSARAQNLCELCNASDNLDIFHVPDSPEAGTNEDEHAVLACQTCRDQMAETTPPDMHHWRCLNDSMWSQTPSVQVMAWRMLHRLSAERWAVDLADMLYLDEATLAWAQAGVTSALTTEQNEMGEEIHKDSNGATLHGGDTVTLIKDLNVKGAGFTAKRGTAVRNISLVADNPAHIEGRVNGQQIVILTEFVKKSG